MNNKRRAEIATVIETLNNILMDEDDYRDNMPENLQESQRYEDSEAASESLQDAIDALEEIG